jgi:hypothetical protein
MSDVVSGFNAMVWQIIGYDGTEEILRQQIPLDQADVARMSDLLKSFASKNLRPDEIAAGLADVRPDTTAGNRIVLMAGENPHYVASLWRSDELEK